MNPQSHHRRFSDFPVGTRVRVVAHHQDFQFFRGDETGEVVENGRRYLSITVRFDEPRLIHALVYESGRPTCYKQPHECAEHGDRHVYDHREHGFNPADLLIEGEVVNADTVKPETDWPDLNVGLFGRSPFLTPEPVG